MHGRSQVWVRDHCKVEGAGRALLWAITGFGDRHYGACTASARTLAKAAGISHRQAQRILPDLVALGILEMVDPGRGRKPTTYRITASLWERSYDTTSQQESSFVTTSENRSYDIEVPVATTSDFRSYDTSPPLTSENGAQGKSFEGKSFEGSATRLTSPFEGRSQTAVAGRADARPSSPQPSVVEGEASTQPLTAEERVGGWAVPDGELDDEQYRRMRAAEKYLKSAGAVWYDEEPYGYVFPRGLGDEVVPGYLIPSKPSDLNWIRWAEEHQRKAGQKQDSSTRLLIDLLFEVEECSGGEWEGAAIRLPNGHLIDTVQAAKAFLARHPRGD